MVNVRTIFMAAPFLAGISWKLAEKIQKLERWSGIRLGSLLVVEAKVNDQLDHV